MNQMGDQMWQKTLHLLSFQWCCSPDLAGMGRKHLCWQQGWVQHGWENAETEERDMDIFFQWQWLVSQQDSQCLHQLSHRASRRQLPGTGTVWGFYFNQTKKKGKIMFYSLMTWISIKFWTKKHIHLWKFFDSILSMVSTSQCLS